MDNKSCFKVLPKSIRNFIGEKNFEYMQLQEIKLRAEKPLIVINNGKEFILEKNRGKPYVVTKEELKETLDYVSNYSLYAFEEEMKQGFITIEGGHRVGISGQVILENGKVKNIKYISSINIRVSHEVIGCSDPIIFNIIKNNQFLNTMIISPPGCGKTTLLRDTIRQLSDGNAYIKGMTVGVVDERSEIGGCYKGIPQNHIGLRTDILDCCPKAEGMIMLIRSMAPQVIAVDEIGTTEDVHSIEYAMHCGCKMLVTAHGNSFEDVRSKPGLSKLISAKSFERYIVLNNQNHIGEIAAIYDEMGERL